MPYKFHCPSCAQRISATPDLLGTSATCPSCGVSFIVPVPEAKKKLADLVAGVEALGLTYDLPPESDDSEQFKKLDDTVNEFFREITHLDEFLREKLASGEFKQPPTATERREIDQRLFKKIVDRDWHGTEDERKEIILRVIPR